MRDFDVSRILEYENQPLVPLDLSDYFYKNNGVHKLYKETKDEVYRHKIDNVEDYISGLLEQVSTTDYVWFILNVAKNKDVLVKFLNDNEIPFYYRLAHITDNKHLIRLTNESFSDLKILLGVE